MSEKNTINRRQALKTLAAVTGAVSLASLPAWEKPVIEVGALPAHAQNSSTGAIEATNASGSDMTGVYLEYPDGSRSSEVDIADGASHTFTNLAPIDVQLVSVGSGCYRVYYPCIFPGDAGTKLAAPFEEVCTLAANTTEYVTLSCDN